MNEFMTRAPQSNELMTSSDPFRDSFKCMNFRPTLDLHRLKVFSARPRQVISGASAHDPRAMKTSRHPPPKPSD
jgi:hypothetical protein